MPIAVQCPSCRTRHLLADNLAKETVACIVCGHRFSRTPPAPREVLDVVPVVLSESVLPSRPQLPSQWTSRIRETRQSDGAARQKIVVRRPAHEPPGWSPMAWLILIIPLVVLGVGGLSMLAYVNHLDNQQLAANQQPVPPSPPMQSRTSPPIPRQEWRAAFATISAEHRKTLGPLGPVGFGVIALIFNPDSSRLASQSRGAMTIWDLTDASKERQWQEWTSDGSSVVYRADGLVLATVSGLDSIMLWDAATGANWATISTNGDRARSLVWKPHSDTLACALGNDVALWDVPTRLKGTVFAGHTAKVRSVAYSPDGLRLASASEDHRVILWDPESGQPRFIMEGHTREVRSVAFSPDGKRLASASDDQTVKVWNTDTGLLERTLKVDSSRFSCARCVLFHPKGSGLIAGTDSGDILMWEMPSGDLQAKLAAHTDEVTCLAITPDGQTLASGSRDCTIGLWSVNARP